MTVREAASGLGGRVAAGETDATREVLGGYACDLLSDVIANAQDGDLWVTLQKHPNIVAVARLKNLAGVVIVNGREPEPETIARAAEEHVPIVTTPLEAFEAIGVLHALGVRGRRNPASVHA
jgi:hypothetical protein